MTKYSEFPESEYEKRYKDLTKRGKEDNIEAFIFTDELNLRYFAGGPLTDVWVCRNDFVVLIIPTDDKKEPTLLLNRARLGAAQPSWIQDKRFWEASIDAAEYNEALKMILKVLKEKKLSRGKIATEIGMSEKLCIPVLIFKEIENNLKNNEIISAHDYVMATRAVKSKMEIDAIRAACHISTQAFEKGLESIKEGVSEKDISRTIKEEMFKLGADSVPFLTVIAGWEGRSIQCDSYATDYKLKKGDVVQFDGGCAVKGYCADMCRTGALGYIKDKRYLELYQAVKEAQHTVRSTLKNGAIIKDVCSAGKNYFINNGYEDLLVFEEGQTGHGIGLGLHEPPFLLYGSTEKMQEGMIVAIEPSLQEKPIWEDSLYFTIIENNYVITSTSYEQLTTSPEDIRII